MSNKELEPIFESELSYDEFVEYLESLEGNLLAKLLSIQGMKDKARLDRSRGKIQRFYMDEEGHIRYESEWKKPIGFLK